MQQQAAAKIGWLTSRISKTIVFWVCVNLLVVEALILVPSTFNRRAELIDNMSLRAGVQIADLLDAVEDHSQLISPRDLPSGILALHIYRNDGTLVYQGSDKAVPGWLLSFGGTPIDDAVQSIELQRQYVVDGHEYLALVRVDTRSVGVELFDYILRIALLVLIIAGALIIGTWIVMQATVVAPLRRVIKALQNPDTEGTLEWGREDEFGELIESYNTMRENERIARQSVLMKQCQLESLAYVDAITGLSNRRAFLNHIGSLNADDKVAVHIVKLRGLQMVNDQHGSEVCDRVITGFANRLAGLCDTATYCARLEGGEFVTVQKLAQDNPDPEVREWASRIVRSMRRPYELEEGMVRLSVSVGVGLSQDAGVEAAYKNASIASRDTRGRSNQGYCIYDKEMREQRLVRANRASEITRAIGTDAFFPVYQPQVSIHSQTIVGAECLMRWRGESGELVPPDEFIPIAEETGMIIPLGADFLQTVLREVCQWNIGNAPDFRLSINISAVQLQDSRLPIVVANALRETGFPPARLEIELTESAIMRDTRESIDVLNALSAIGVQIAIDDFGTGYSSLSYLKQLPVDTLKIDQSFVFDICDSDDDAAIVNAVIGLAHHFNLNVVAEGIESAQHMDFLRAHDCDIGQGYFIGKPMPANDFLGWCNNWQRRSA